MIDIQPLVIASPPKHDIESNESASNKKVGKIDQIPNLELLEPERRPREPHRSKKVIRSRSLPRERTSHFMMPQGDDDIDEVDLIGSRKRRQSSETVESLSQKSSRSKVIDVGRASKTKAPEHIKLVDSIEAFQPQDKFSPIKKPKVPTPEPTPGSSTDEPIKKRRGRPRKHEQVIREMKVTRKSLRISDKPDLAQRTPSTIVPSTGPKALKPLDLSQLLTPVDTSDSSQSPNFPTFSPLTGEISKLSGSLFFNARSPGVHINTLSVLLEYIKDYSPRPKANEIVNESVILEEYKTAYVKLVEDLLVTHSSIVDISAKISETHRKKNELRKKIIETKEALSVLSSETENVRQELDDFKSKHSDVMSLVQSLRNLQNSINHGDLPICLSSTVLTKLDTYNRVFDSQWGLKARLESVNANLASIVRELEHDE